MYYLKGLEPFAANCCTLQRFNKRKTETKNIANAYYDTKKYQVVNVTLVFFITGVVNSRCEIPIGGDRYLVRVERCDQTMEREPLSACEAMIMKVIWDQKRRYFSSGAD